MTDEENWKLRGIYAQVASIQQAIVEAFASGKLSENRKRELKRSLQFIAEQLDHISDAPA